MDTAYLRYAAIAVGVIVLVFLFLPKQAVVEVGHVKAAPQKFGPPMVTATLTNSGAPVDVAYWIEKDRTGKRYCGGVARLNHQESREVSFPCPGLANHRGQFSLETGPAG